MADTERRVADVNENIQAVCADLEVLRRKRQTAEDAVTAAVEAAESKSTRSTDKTSAEGAVTEARGNLKGIEEEIRENKNLLSKLLDEKLRLEMGLTSTAAANAISDEPFRTTDEKGSRTKSRRVEEDISKVVTGIRSFKTDAIQPGVVVVLPPAVRGASSQALYVREEYITALALWTKQREALGGGMMLVIGTPGIGKSLFGRLVFTLEMAKGSTVLWVTGEERILFHGDMAVKIGGVSDIGDLDGLKYADVIIVYDTVVGLHKFFGDQSLEFKCVLALHSPSAQINSTKKHMSGDAVKFVMNPFGLPEMLEFRRKIETPFPNIASKMGDEGTIKEKFAVCGGSLRFALLSIDIMRQEIDGAKTKLTGDLFKNAVNGGLLSGDSGRVCHSVLHMWRVNDKFGEYVLRFCSDVVKDSVLSTIASSSVSDLLSLANTVDINGSLRSQVWENRVHNIFCEGKDILIDTRRLDDGKTSRTTIPSMTGSSVFDKIEDVDCKMTTYYRPKRSNFETVNAFFVYRDISNDLVAVLVQSTVSTSHSVKFAGLDSVLRCIDRGLGRVPKRLLVFLTPPVAYDKFSQRPQKITIKGGGAAAKQDIVQQQVWGVADCGGRPIW
eukprot:m.1000707 g.1000707  ORF g.1000707 m.1000707 type:complete len:613 (+) comp24028_c0_seq6:185-2023(+)